MARIGPHLTQRMVINHWVYFSDELGVLKSLPQFRNLEVPNFYMVKDCPLLGFVYVDHDAGISLKVEGLFFPESQRTPEKVSISNFIRDSVSLKFRYDVIRMLDLHILEDNERKHMSLPEHPEWLQFYESPELIFLRDCTMIDPLRAEGFFDDVYAVLPATVILGSGSDEPTTLKPEIVWVRLSDYSNQAKQFRGRLLNQPHQDFGVKKNDVVSLRPVKSTDENLVLVVGKC